MRTPAPLGLRRHLQHLGRRRALRGPRPVPAHGHEHPRLRAIWAATSPEPLAELINGLRRCEAPDCDAVLVDRSKNRSRRYCDTGNCGNRQHVAAYRERRAGREADRTGPEGARAGREAARAG